MSGRFKPEIIVVRRQLEDGRWREATERDRPFNHPDFALLVRGVPMVGERVTTSAGYTMPVVGHSLRVLLGDRDLLYAPEELFPVPDEDEALVERVAHALLPFIDMVCPTTDLDAARAAIRAMKEGER